MEYTGGLHEAGEVCMCACVHMCVHMCVSGNFVVYITILSMIILDSPQSE